MGTLHFLNMWLLRMQLAALGSTLLLRFSSARLHWLPNEYEAVSRKQSVCLKAATLIRKTDFSIAVCSTAYTAVADGRKPRCRCRTAQDKYHQTI